MPILEFPHLFGQSQFNAYFRISTLIWTEPTDEVINEYINKHSEAHQPTSISNIRLE